MTENPNRSCSRCGTPISTDAAGGLCPRCLMAMNFHSRTMPEGEEPPHAPPISPEELAERFPQYEILECLGRGGMGVVYKARQKSLNRIVAIKILAPEREHEPHFAERFAREAELLAKLNHPHIVTIHDFGVAGSQPSTTDSQPLYYLVMEFVDGVNLRDLLRDGKLEPKQALAIVPPICEALQYAHDKGIVHRDIKPENLLLDREGRIKIADFGIAGLVGAGGENIGTPPYMAPEQSGAQGGIDHRADIYALGVVLYEMLTGERPAKDLVAPSKKVQIDVRLDEMVLRALEKSPEMRYQTAGEFRTVIETMQRPPLKSNPPPIPDSSPPRGMFRRWWWLLLVMIPLGLALGLAAGAVLNYVTPKKYEAQTTIEVRPPEGAQITPQFFGTEFEKLKSREALAELAKRLELENRWLLQEAEVISLLKGIVTVQNIRGTDLLIIRVRHSNAGDATEIANNLTAIYREKSANEAIVHETAIEPEVPVSPNLTLNLVLAALAGLVTSPLIALLGMVILHRLIPERRPDARVSNGTGTRLPDTPGGEAGGLGLTLTLHALLFATIIGLVFLVLPPWARLMEEFGAPLPSIARHILDLGRLWVIIALLVLFVIDVSGCFLARKFGGRTALHLWSISVIVGLVIMVLLMGLAISKPVLHLSAASRQEPGLRLTDRDMAQTASGPTAATAKQSIETIEAINDTNRFLDLELAVIDAKANGLGEKHPSVIEASDVLARFQETHPHVPDSVWRRLVGNRLAETKEKLAELSASGLGGAHPAVRQQQARMRALAELIEKPIVAEAEKDERSDKIAVEDLALHMIVAIREKNDAKLKSLASDRIKGWPDALPVFAVELREHFRQFTGNDTFDLKAGESLVDGDLAAVRCTGPAALEGKCLVFFFVKTADGWRNHSLRNSTVSTPLAKLLADLKVAIQKEK